MRDAKKMSPKPVGLGKCQKQSLRAEGFALRRVTKCCGVDLVPEGAQKIWPVCSIAFRFPLSSLALLRLNLRRRDHLAPFGIVLGQELRVIGDRGADHVDADLRHPLVEALVGNDRRDLAMERLD